MPSRKLLKSAVHNFLSTFVSRYSAFNGYWLFGFLVSQDSPLKFNLLSPTACADGAAAASAAKLAAKKFREQLAKHGLDASLVGSGEVLIEWLPIQVEGQVNGRPTLGYQVRVAARAATDRGRVYESSRILFVAPHNRWREWRSAGST